MSKYRDEAQALSYASDGNAPAFYCSQTWRVKRREVLEADRYECQDCKARGIYSKATDVHHVITIYERPDLAIASTYTDDSGGTHRQLISLCAACHFERHAEEREPKSEPLTVERW